jgi:hypothetical protein
MKRYLDAIHFLTLKYYIDVSSIQKFLTKEDNIYLANKLVSLEDAIDETNKEGLKYNFNKDYRDIFGKDIEQFSESELIN